MEELDIKEYTESIDEMWANAETRFLQKTSKSLRNSTKVRLEDIYKVLDAKYSDKSSDTDDAKKQAKKWIGNVLGFIKLLGGIASQAASMVFGPATLCYSAVQFLIEIPATVSKLYDGLAQLFEDVSASLAQFKIYKRIEKYTTIDPELKKTTHELMISFVDICALSIQVLGSRRKEFSFVAKAILFANDSGVGSELEKFQRLVDRHSRISDAVTLESVLKSRHEESGELKAILEMLTKEAQTSERVSEQVGYLYDRQTAQAETERIDWLMQALTIEPEKSEASEKRWRQIWDQSVKQSGNWIQKFDEYREWSDLESKSDVLLLLYGPEGSGKSHLMASIVQDLKSKQEDSARNTMRTNVAYYFHPERDKKAERDGAQDLYILLKSLAVQIAKVNVNYAKEMKTLWTGKEKNFSAKDMSYQKLCTDLQLFTPKNDSSYILVLDGLDQLAGNAKNQLFGILMNVKHPKVRILVSGVSEVLNLCLGDDFTAPTIYIPSNNFSDIKQFVETELERNELLQESEKDIVDLKMWIINVVPNVVNGSFTQAQRVLSRIKTAILADDKTADGIKNLVQDQSLIDGSTAVKQIINSLNVSLNDLEIEELNELLIWTIYGYRYFDVKKMKAALSLRFSRTPLQPLEKKLNGKYAKVLRVDSDGDVVLDNWDIDTFLRNSPSRSIKVEAKDKPKISMEIKIHQADMDTVKRFLWDLSERGVFQNFSFSESSQNEKKATISAHPVDSHLSITMQCFKLLLSEPDETMKGLTGYALLKLPEHLDELRNFAESGQLDLAEKKEILEKLVEFCHANYNVEKNWNDVDRSEEWFERINTFNKWLEDEEVVRNIAVRDRLWVEECLKSKNPGLMCLKEITKMVAKLWLLDAEREQIRQDYRWVARFIAHQSKQEPREKGDQDKQENNARIEPSEPLDQAEADAISVSGSELSSSIGSVDIDESTISKAIEWAKTQLEVKEDSLWFQRVGQTYLDFSEYGAAKSAFQQALNLPNAHWKSNEGLALVHEDEGDLPSAIKQMELVVQELRRRPTLEETERADFIRDLLHLATWQRQLQPPRIGDAISLYEEVLRHDPNSYLTCWLLLDFLYSAERLDDGRSLLKRMSNQRGKNTELSMLGEMLLNFYENEIVMNRGIRRDTFNVVFHITKKDALFPVIITALEDAIELCRKKKNKTSILSELLLDYSTALMRYSDEEKRVDLALAGWKECYNVSLKEGYSGIDTCLQVSSYLGINYVAQVLSHKEDSKTYMAELTQLANQDHDYYRIGYNFRYVLASYYAVSNEIPKAKKIIKIDMRIAMDLLSDDDPDNDHEGYAAMADLFVCLGDDLNALSAWSLLVPDEDEDDDDEKSSSGQVSKPPGSDESSESLASLVNNTPKKVRRGKGNYDCDGDCDTLWTYADNIWHCRVCPGVLFEDNCQQKCQNGALNKYVCSPDHQFLHVPPWSDEEYLEVGKDRVRIGGELVDGKRVGGKIIPVKEWLDIIRDEWGLPKEPTKVDSPV